MTDRPGSHRLTGRAALVVFAVVTVVAAVGVWWGQASGAEAEVGAAPRTAAAQQVSAGTGREPASGEPSGGLPGVRDCGFGAPEVRPEVITLACADAGVVATGISWQAYGADGATGTGVVQVERTAADGGGPTAGFPATFRLSGARTVDGARAFTALSVRYEGSTPFGDPTETYSLA